MIPVVLSIVDPEFRENRVFDAEAVGAMRGSLLPMARPWLRAAAVAREAGFRFVTGDQALAGDVDPRQALLVSYNWPPSTEALLDAGARPAALVTLEPPLIAWDFYLRLPSLSARFPHTFVFEGARDRVAPGSQFHPMRFPQVDRPPRPPGRHRAERGYLVMVNSNKGVVRSPLRWFDRPREVSAKRWLAALRYPPIDCDLWRERLRAIAFFSGQPGFDLYGEGWERRHPAVTPRLHAAALRAYRGRASDKLELLAGYRFALAIENTALAGYVSEKLFDGFLAGCVPVYRGAPDVERYVPPEAFVDARRFRTYADLHAYLSAMPEAEWRRYRGAGEAFLTSSAYQPFTLDAFARNLVEVLRAVAESSPSPRGRGQG